MHTKTHKTGKTEMIREKEKTGMTKIQMGSIDIPQGCQVGGTHYQDTTIQPWDVMQDWFTHEEYRGALMGGIMKRLKRWKQKGGIEDLRKMQQELAELIRHECRMNDTPY